MDPVSALSVAGVALQLAGLCISVPKALSDIKQRYNELEASKTIRNINYFCKAVELAAKNIQAWLSSDAADRITGLADWKDILVGYVEVVQDLQDDIDKIVGSENGASGSLLDRSQRVKLVWNQSTMQQHLENLQYLSSALHLLLDATKLSLDLLPHAVHQIWEDAKSISSTRRSLLSRKDADLDAENTVRFAFDVILTSSPVYQRASTFARAVPSAETDSSSWNSTTEDETRTRNDTDARTHGPQSGHPSPEDGVEVVNGSEESSSLLLANFLSSPELKVASEEHYFHVPFHPVPHQSFYGRRDILSAMNNYFGCGETDEDVPICTLSGLGGVGKSWIAHEYSVASFRQSGIYNSVWWINGESRISIAMSFSLINTQLNLTATTSPWLLVFDNVNDPANLSELFPKSPKFRGSGIIITTRDPVVRSWQKSLSIPILPFTHDEGVDFLRRQLEDNPGAPVPPNEIAHQGALDETVDILGGLPLALSMVARYIKESGTSLSEYLRLYTEAQAGPKIQGSKAEYYSTFEQSFSLSLARLSGPALALLQMLAFLDPDNIDQGILLSERIRFPTSGSSPDPDESLEISNDLEDTET